MAITITTIETPGLGDRCHLVHDGDVAFVVDPPRDIDRVQTAAVRDGVRITHVFETHVHNDYASGGLALAQRSGAEYGIASGEHVTFVHRPLEAGERVDVGAMTVDVLATPGHTHHHLAYLVHDSDGPVAVFTGGSMLYGTVGRTDLVGDDHSETLTRAQWNSVRALLAQLPDGVEVCPTHGFGSLCASTPVAERTRSTIAQERRDNLAGTIDDEDEFVRRLLSEPAHTPAYYAHMDPLNRAGLFEPDLSPLPTIAAHDLRRRLEHREWVVDLRDRRAFASEHLAGSIGIDLAESFATHLGSLLPWGSRLTLLGWSAEQLATAQRELARLGIDRPAAGRAGPIEDMAGNRPVLRYEVADFRQLAERRATGSDIEVVDVRHREEYHDRHIDGAHLVPLYQLLDHLHHVPPGELWVHCSSGVRAAIAASLLERAGHPVVLVDDDIDNMP